MLNILNYRHSRHSSRKTRFLELICGCTIGVALTTPAYAQLDSAMATAKASTAASAASQLQIERLDDEAEQMVREYRAVLQQKDNVSLYVDQRDLYVQSQNSEIQSLGKQLTNIEIIKKSITPMMLRMAVAIENSIKTDVPFQLPERLARLERIKEALADPGLTPADQYRLLLKAYQIEVSYGQQLTSYEGPHPTRPGNVVNFLRFGRVSLVYMSKDGKEVARYVGGEYNMPTSWARLKGAKARQLRQAIRVAKKQAAPEIVFAPITVEQ